MLFIEQHKLHTNFRIVLVTSGTHCRKVRSALARRWCFQCWPRPGALSIRVRLAIPKLASFEADAFRAEIQQATEICVLEKSQSRNRALYFPVKPKEKNFLAKKRNYIQKVSIVVVYLDSGDYFKNCFSKPLRNQAPFTQLLVSNHSEIKVTMLYV